MRLRDYFLAIANEPQPAVTVDEVPPKPKLAAAVRFAPSRDAFEAWREHPVSLFVFAALSRAADEQQTTWATTSWHGGTADQALLNELRVRADAYRAIEEGAYEAFCEWAGVEPEAKVAE